MTQQYLRDFSLVVGNIAGNGLDLSELHCKFQTHQATTQTPGWLNVRIYNLSAATQRTVQREFTNVEIQAGYDGNRGRIFKGQIRQFLAGKENATDSYLDIIAQDGDAGYNFAVMGGSANGKTGTTLAAGWKSSDVVASAMQSMGLYGITQGYMPEFAAYPNPRGKVMFGMTRDTLRNLTDTTGTNWCINENALTITPIAQPQPGAAVVLTAYTGMIGLPVQTINGINVRCLLNPTIKFAGQIRIDNASVQGQQISVAYGAVNQFPSLDADGFYKVFSVEHTGDTRGQAWYSDLITVAVDGTAPLAGPYLNAVASST